MNFMLLDTIKKFSIIKSNFERVNMTIIDL
jgi:hypothetical protein